jgi:hypothetical protein
VEDGLVVPEFYESASIATIASAEQRVGLGQHFGQAVFAVPAFGIGRLSFFAVRVPPSRGFGITAIAVLATAGVVGPFDLRLIADPGVAVFPDAGNIIDGQGSAMNGVNIPLLLATYVLGSVIAPLAGTLLFRTPVASGALTTSSFIVSATVNIPRGMLVGLFDTVGNEAFTGSVVGNEAVDSALVPFEV